MHVLLILQKIYIHISATIMIRRLEDLSCEERLRDSRLFSLKKGRLLIAVFQFLKRAYKKDGERRLPGLVVIGQGVTF